MIVMPIAPPSEDGSMVRPKLKKKMAPKKSLKGMIWCSIRLTCLDSPSTRPIINAPMASATCNVSEKPATRKSSVMTVSRNNSDDLIFSALSIYLMLFLPIIRNSTINSRADRDTSRTLKNEVAPLSTSPVRMEI
ncbi:hypothetical protein D3C74_398100 [compost metagenome]